MKLVCFGSSSAGNSYYIELNRKDRPPVKLLVEVGLTFNEIVTKSSINKIDLTEIDAILVTHNHQDHCKAVPQFRKRGFKIYGNSIITQGDLRTTLHPGQAKVIALDTIVTPFEVEHDAPEPLGFVISSGLETILFVNDNKYFKADLSHIKFDYVLIESNYDGRTIHYALQNARDANDYPSIRRYERIINSHMSVSNTVKMLKGMNLSRTKSIFLMHLSDRHANEFKFKEMVQKATNIQTFVCKKSGGII